MGSRCRPLPCTIHRVRNPTTGHLASIYEPEVLESALDLSFKSTWPDSTPYGRNYGEHGPSEFKARWRRVTGCLFFRWRRCLRREEQRLCWRAPDNIAAALAGKHGSLTMTQRGTKRGKGHITPTRQAKITILGQSLPRQYPGWQCLYLTVREEGGSVARGRRNRP